MTTTAPARFVAPAPSARPPGVDADRREPTRFVARRGGAAPEARPALRALDPTVFGQLTALLRDPSITDAFIGHGGRLFLDHGAGPRPMTGWRALGEAEVRRLAVRIIAAGGRHLDEASPCIDVRLGAEVRAHAVLAPIASNGTALSLRFGQREMRTLDALCASGTLTRSERAHLRGLVHRRRNVLITGAGGAGKTTLLTAMLAEAPAGERIVTVEDVAELALDHPHVIALETRQANLEGAGDISLTRLLREALRMRPDRLVVGEVRGAEVRDLFAALNTGHDGGAGTLHANSLADVPARLEALGALAGLDAIALARQAVSAIHEIVHLERAVGGRRIAARGVLELDPDGRLRVHELSAPVAQPRPTDASAS